MRFVIDNSVVMRWLFGDGSLEDIEYAERILEILKVEGNMAMAPAIWPLEVGNVIVRAEARNFLAFFRKCPSKSRRGRPSAP